MLRIEKRKKLSTFGYITENVSIASDTGLKHYKM